MEERNCFLCSGHLRRWVKDGIVAGLNSQGIPSLWEKEEKGGKKNFPKEKLLVEAHVLF